MAQMSEDARFERLPKWAQRWVLGLEMEKARAEGELEAARHLLNGGDAETAPIVVDRYSANRQYLGVLPETPVEFRFKPEGSKWWKYFHVNMTSERKLYVSGSDGILVKPSSGNSIKVELED